MQPLVGLGMRQIGFSGHTGESGNELMEMMTPKFEGGYYLPPTGPGFGVEFSDAILRKYAPGVI